MEGKEAQSEQQNCSFGELENAVKTEYKTKIEETSGGDMEKFLMDRHLMEKDEEKIEQPLELDSRLATLICTAKLGDVRTLQKMATAVRIFLTQSNLEVQKRLQSVFLLLDRDDFFPLLFKCLKTNVTRIPQLVADGLWILNAIMDTGDTKICRKLDALVDAGLIQLMPKLMSMQDNGVHEMATEALENLICWGYRDQLSVHAIPIFSAIATMLKKRNRSIYIQKMCVHIISGILGQVRPTASSKASEMEAVATKKINENNDLPWRSKEFVDNLPPISWVKEAIPLLNILVNAKDNEVLGKALSCLTYAGCVEGSFQYIIDCGIMKKVVANINHLDEVVRFFSITSISSIASINETVAINFLKSMKGTFGLKHFYLGLISNNKSLRWAADQFFTNAVNAVTMDRHVSDLNNILTSGIIHTFVQCLKPGMCEKHIIGAAWALGRISAEVSVSQRRLIVDAGALPLLVDQLKNEDTVVSAIVAVTIGSLVQDKPLNRNQIVNMGAIPNLIKLISRDDVSIPALVSSLAALELIAAVKPYACPEVMKDLPQALIVVLDKKSTKCLDKVSPGIYSIIGKLCDSGFAGIDLVLECGFLKRLASALNSGNEYTLVFALDAFKCISHGTKEQTDKLMEEVDIVETLQKLLQHPIRHIRKLASCILSNLNKEQLIFQQNNSELLRELQNQDPREIHPAGLAFQNVLSNFTFR